MLWTVRKRLFGSGNRIRFFGLTACWAKRIVPLFAFSMILSPYICSICAQHFSEVLRYVTCNRDFNDPDTNPPGYHGLFWEVTWSSDNTFFHRPASDTPGAPHPEAYIQYMTWDGTCWQAKWEIEKEKFAHIRYEQVQHYDRIINYVTWPMSSGGPSTGDFWSAVREGNGFRHFPYGTATGKKSVVKYTDGAGKKRKLTVKPLPVVKAPKDRRG